MYPYRQSQLDLFYNLVVQANPGMPFSLPPNSKLGTPASQSVPSGGIADTNILITGKNAYYRNQRVQYRRIDLSAFFKNMTINFDKWVSTTTLPKADLIELLNATYGLAIVDADLTLTSLNSGQPWTVAIASTSLCYKGSFVVTWTKGKRQITDLVANNSEMDGRVWPGGNSFPVGRKPQGEYLLYDLDFTAQTATFNALTTGTLDYTNANHKIVMDAIIAKYPNNFNSGVHTAQGGLNGLTFAKYTMPNVNVPLANSSSTKVNTVFAIVAQSTSWFQGSILLHYKV